MYGERPNFGSHLRQVPSDQMPRDAPMRVCASACGRVCVWPRVRACVRVAACVRVWAWVRACLWVRVRARIARVYGAVRGCWGHGRG